jgi:hypothetical protein
MKFNHLAIFLVVILQQVLGFIWYSPSVLFNPWVEGIGKKAEDLNANDMSPFAASIIGAFVFCYALAWLLSLLKSDSAKKGAVIGVLAVLGFAAPMLATHLKFAGMGWSVVIIDISKELVGWGIGGGILSVWKKR